MRPDPSSWPLLLSDRGLQLFDAPVLKPENHSLEAVAPKLWNSLSQSVRLVESFCFK